MKKLYRVAVEVTVYVLAEDGEKAEEIGREGVRSEIEAGSEHPISIAEVQPGDVRAEGWTRSSLPYGCGETTLGEALDALEGQLGRRRG